MMMASPPVAPTPTSSVCGRSTSSLHHDKHSQQKRFHEKQQYAHARARTCMRLLEQPHDPTGQMSPTLSGTTWQSQGHKSNIELFKTASKDVAATRAVALLASTSLDQIVATLFDGTRSSARFQHLWQAVFPSSYVHAEVVEDLTGPSSSDQRATTKWYALQLSKLRRPMDLFVVEWIGLVFDTSSPPRISACFLFQESFADMGDIKGLAQAKLPPIPFERAHLDALLVQFVASETGGIRMSVVVQQPPALLALKFLSPAGDFAFQLARGLQNALAPSHHRSSLWSLHLGTSVACHHCTKPFHVFRRASKLTCGGCSQVICKRPACAVTCPAFVPLLLESEQRRQSTRRPRQPIQRAATCPPPSIPPIDQPAAAQAQAATFQCATAWTMNTDGGAGIKAALAELAGKLPAFTFLAVHYSSHLDPAIIQTELHQTAPGVTYIGGSIGRGICDDDAWVATSSSNRAGLVAVFGIFDPDGQYDVDHVAYDSPATAARHVTAVVKGRPAPDFCLAMASPLFVDPVMAALGNLPVVGGCATDANDNTWSQISSARAATCNGLALAFCSPTVVTHRSWFSGYDVLPVPAQVVTAVDASKTRVLAINDEPAATVYAKWLGPARWSASSFPRVGTSHPLAVGPDQGVQGQDSVAQTRVVVGADLSTGVLSLSSPIEVGTCVRVMELTRKSLGRAMAQWGDDVAAKTNGDDVQGCLLYFSASLQGLMGSHRMADMVSAWKSKAWSDQSRLMGLTTFGQLGGGDLKASFDPLMFSALLFSTQRKSPANDSEVLAVM